MLSVFLSISIVLRVRVQFEIRKNMYNPFMNPKPIYFHCLIEGGLVIFQIFWRYVNLRELFSDEEHSQTPSMQFMLTVKDPWHLVHRS